MLQGHFQFIKNDSDGKMKIALDETFQSYVTIDLQKVSDGGDDFIVQRCLEG
jgi:hypothetical protein